MALSRHWVRWSWLPALLAVAAVLVWAATRSEPPDHAAATAPAPAHAAPAPVGPGAQEALEAAIAAGDWLVRTQRDDGEFAYTYDPIENEFSQKGYSYVRHAGVVWSLIVLHRRTGDEAYLRCAERGLRRMEQVTQWEGPVAYVVSRNSAPLGGAALAAVAYLALEKPTHLQRRTAAGLGEMILRLLGDDGRFRSHYPVKPPLETKEIRSVYYPGEALLALTRLYAQTRDPKWLQAARKAGRYLATRRDRDFGYTEPPPDHWYVIAVAELAPLLRERAAAADADERDALSADAIVLTDYAFKVSDVLVAGQITAARARYPEYEGGGDNYDPPRSAPAATRGEALTAVCRLADGLGQPRERYLGVLRGYARFVLRLQHGPGASSVFPEPENAIGCFAASPADPRTRMDYQQHAISCLLGLESLTRPQPTSDQPTSSAAPL